LGDDPTGVVTHSESYVPTETYNVQTKKAIITCLPKSINTQTPDDYRPISLLTTEYKLLARILARRLRPILAEQLQNNQYCGVPGNSMLDAISSVRDVIAHAEATGAPLWF
jgi:mannosylglycoprotein endo-beta-mannosidase